jgi:cytoskeletal protein RodZ
MNLGEMLSAARLAAGISLEDLAAATSIRVGLLTEIEKNNFSHCGGDIYARGHLRNIAPILGLDPARLIELFNEEHSVESRSIKELLIENNVTKVPKEKKNLSWKVPAAFSIVVLLIFATVQIVVSNVQSGNDASPAASSSPSPTASAEPSASAVTTETTTTENPANGKVTLLITAPRGDSRIDIWVDGKQIEKGTIYQGESKSYEGLRSIAIYFSNPAGLDVTVNGELLAPLGGENQEVRRTFR